MGRRPQRHENVAQGLSTEPEAQRAAAPLRVLESGEVAPRQMSDEDLMLEHGTGNEDAFEELVRRHHKGVLNFAFRMTQNRQVAEEITQDVFLALVKNAKRYRPTAKFTTYLYRITRNIVSKEWLKAKRRPRLFSFGTRSDGTGESGGSDPVDNTCDESADVLGDLERVEVTEAVNSALRKLPPQQREAFVLRRFEHLSYEEMSEVTDSPVGTLKSRVVRAERALRPLLANFKEYI